MNYYNENDKYAANWLRNLIEAGLLPVGDVDERSIVDVVPGDLEGYTQCHFFAGIGGWSEALRLAGWPSGLPVWTGSCPCQSFSAAGKRKGFEDERHLWPVWFELIKKCQPPVVFGEQVEAAIKHGWLDLVQDDLAGQGYTCGAAVLPACGVGAPHIRQRLWFMAYRHCQGLERRQAFQCQDQQPVGTDGVAGRLDYPDNARYGYEIGRIAEEKNGEADRFRKDIEIVWKFRRTGTINDVTSGYWQETDWIYCTDERLRPTEPGILPLVDGLSPRMVKIRGYGNAIVPQVAAEVIRAGMAFLRLVP